MCQPEWLSLWGPDSNVSARVAEPCGGQIRVLVMLLLPSHRCTGKGVWENLGKLHHPELQGLVCSLKATVLTSRAPSTMSKYTNAFKLGPNNTQRYQFSQ